MVSKFHFVFYSLVFYFFGAAEILSSPVVGLDEPEERIIAKQWAIGLWGFLKNRWTGRFLSG